MSIDEVWKCYNKSCESYNSYTLNSCQRVCNSASCAEAILTPPKPLPKQLIELDKQSVEELSIIILDRSFSMAFRRLALEEHDGRFTL